MLRSLVGSEMCIRDSVETSPEVDTSPREMPQLSPVLVMEGQNLDISSTIIHTPPLLQGPFSPHTQFMTDTQTHHDRQHYSSPTHEQSEIMTTKSDHTHVGNPTLTPRNPTLAAQSARNPLPVPELSQNAAHSQFFEGTVLPLTVPPSTGAASIVDRPTSMVTAMQPLRTAAGISPVSIDDDLLRRPSFTSSRVFEVLASVPHSVSTISATQSTDRPTVLSLIHI